MWPEAGSTSVSPMAAELPSHSGLLGAGSVAALVGLCCQKQPPVSPASDLAFLSKRLAFRFRSNYFFLFFLFFNKVYLFFLPKFFYCGVAGARYYVSVSW